MAPHFAGLAALGTRGRGLNAVWEGLVRRNEVPSRRPRSITMKTYRAHHRRGPTLRCLRAAADAAIADFVCLKVLRGQVRT